MKNIYHHKIIDIVLMILFPRIGVKYLYQRERSIPPKTFPLPLARVIALLVSLLFSYLTVSPAYGQEPVGLGKTESKRLLLDIDNCIRYKPKFGAHRQILQKEPQADLIRFPLVEYTIDTLKLGYIQIGELVPDEILDLRLQVINHPTGKSYTTLRELQHSQFLVLDFWAKWCKPCLISMQYWESIRPTIDKDIHVVGVHMDFDYKAELEVRSRGFKGMQIVGPETAILKRYFMPFEGIGPSVWLRDGQLFGISRSTPVSHDYIFQLISGELKELPEYADQTKVKR